MENRGKYAGQFCPASENSSANTSKNSDNFKIYSKIHAAGILLFALVTLLSLCFAVMTHAGFAVCGNGFENAFTFRISATLTTVCAMLFALSVLEVLYFIVRAIGTAATPCVDIGRARYYICDAVMIAATIVVSSVAIAEAGKWMADPGVGMILSLAASVLAAVGLAARIVVDKKYFAHGASQSSDRANTKIASIEKKTAIFASVLTLVALIAVAVAVPVASAAADFSDRGNISSLNTRVEVERAFGLPEGSAGDESSYLYLEGERIVLQQISDSLTQKAGADDVGARMLAKKLAEKAQYAPYKILYVEFTRGDDASVGYDRIDSYYSKTVAFEEDKEKARSCESFEYSNASFTEQINLVKLDYEAQYDDGSFVKDHVEFVADNASEVTFSDELGEYTVDLSKFERVKAEIYGDYAYLVDKTLHVFANPTAPISGFDRADEIANVVIEAGVTELSDGVFNGCETIESVTFHSDLQSIGAYAFQNCISLREIVIPDGVESIGDYAFSGCESLEKADIADSVGYMGRFVFGGSKRLIIHCRVDEQPDGWDNDWNRNGNDVTWGALSAISSDEYDYVIYGENDELAYLSNYKGTATDVVIPSEINGKKVAGIGAVFENKPVRSVIVPDGVERIDANAFGNCTQLEMVSVPASVKRIESNAFRNCVSLTHVFIDDLAAWCNIRFSMYESNPMVHADNLYLDGALVTDIVLPAGITEICDYAFAGVSSLKSVIIPDGVTIIGEDAFSDCVSLEKVSVPDSVKQIGRAAFSGCVSLAAITIPDRTEIIDIFAFNGCSALTIYCKGAIEGENWDQEWNSDRPVVWYCDHNDVADDGRIYFVEDGIRYAVKDGTATVTEQSTMLSGSIQLPSTVTVNGKTYPVTAIDEKAFYLCDKITGVFIPQGVTAIENRTFLGCSSLAGVSIPDSVKTIGDYAFSNCNSLEQIYIPDGVTTIGEGVFYGCVELKKAYIPASVTHIGESAFGACSALETVFFGENSWLTGIEESVFEDCASLTAIAIPDRVESVGYYAFRNCKSLHTVTFGKDSKLKKIGNEAFYSCEALTGIVLPEGLTEIGDGAFRCNSALESIIIPAGVTKINAYAFDSCGSLESVAFENSTGWRVVNYEVGNGASTVPELLADPATAATYLKTTYAAYTWYRR